VYDRTQHGSNEGLITEVAMSAMPAVALTCDSDIRPARKAETDSRGETAVIPFPGRTRGATPGRTHGATPGRTHGATPGRTHGATPGRTHGVPLRLTRRGRVVVAAVAALLVAVISLLAAGAAQATNHGPPARAARQNLVQVVVRPGQSLWSVAENADPDQDTRAVIQQIIDLNSLSGDTVAAGQQLWVPRG